MPELPEVETVRAQLAPLVEGSVISSLEVLDERWASQPGLAQMVQGLAVKRLRRRGKYLIWQLEQEVHLLMHLRMTGTLLFDPIQAPAHTRVRMNLDAPSRGAGGTHELLFVDPRRFGTGELVVGGLALAAFLDARLGMEPFDAGWTDEHLFRLTRHARTPIKPFLLDQRRIAGIGNIYADEALFRAGVHPLRIAGNLTRVQSARLRQGVQDALRAGIDARGASIDDFRDTDGARGTFQDQFFVHRREGLPCPTCAAVVRKLLVAGRGTYVCERCQPRPRGGRRSR